MTSRRDSCTLAKWYRDYCVRRLPPRGRFAACRALLRPRTKAPQTTAPKVGRPPRTDRSPAVSPDDFNTGAGGGNRHGFSPDPLDKKAICRSPWISRKTQCAPSRLLGSSQGRAQRASSGPARRRLLTSIPDVAARLRYAPGAPGRTLCGVQDTSRLLRRPLSCDRKGAWSPLHELQSWHRPFQ